MLTKSSCDRVITHSRVCNEKDSFLLTLCVALEQDSVKRLLGVFRYVNWRRLELDPNFLKS